MDTLVWCGVREPDPHQICIYTPAEARSVVDSLKAAGADLIKSYEPRGELFFALAAEARRLGIPLTGHLSRDVPVTEALDSGQRIVDHFDGVKEDCLPQAQHPSASLQKCTQLAIQFRRHGAWSLIGPLGPYPKRLTVAEIRSRQQRYIPLGYQRNPSEEVTLSDGTLDFSFVERADLPLLLGSDIMFMEGVWGIGSFDAWVVPGSELHDMLAILVESGLSPLRALQAVTLNPAQFLSGTDSLGTVAAGKLADLVLLDADPLTDIYNTQRIRAVVANGRYFDRAALDTLLAQGSRAP